MSTAPASRSAAEAVGLFVGTVAQASPGIRPRIGYLSTKDHGCRGTLLPGAGLLVQPCDRFLGSGTYQLFAPAGLVTRHCFQLNLTTVRSIDRTRLGAPELVDLTPEAFADQVCGLVVASLEAMDPGLAEDLSAHRGVAL